MDWPLARRSGTHAIDPSQYRDTRGTLLSDILQFDADTDAALARVASANRTCAIRIDLGDAHGNGGSGSFKLLSYSHVYVNIYNDRSSPAYPPEHDLFDSLVFINKHAQVG